MSSGEKVALLDSDDRRRAEAARLIYNIGLHVEPYENYGELRQHWPQAGLVMIHDDAHALADMFELMTDSADWLPVIVYSQEPLPERIVDVVLQGAMDYLAWPFDAAHLRARLRVLFNRKRSFSELRRRAMKAQRLVEGLTGRERQVLFELANGNPNKAIARNLAISPRTVEIHRANMLGKLGVKSSQEAVAVALFADLKYSEDDREERFQPEVLSQ